MCRCELYFAASAHFKSIGRQLSILTQFSTSCSCVRPGMLVWFDEWAVEFIAPQALSMELRAVVVNLSMEYNAPGFCENSARWHCSRCSQCWFCHDSDLKVFEEATWAIQKQLCMRLEIWKYLSVTSNEWSIMQQMRVYPHPEFRETNCLSCAKIKYGNYYFLRPIQLTLCIIDIEPVEELDGDVCWSNFGMENWVIALWTIAFCT